MLHEVLSRYLGDVAAAVRGLEGVYVERYEEEILAANRVNLWIRVRFPNGYLLELNEATIVEEESIRHLGYRYHLQDKQNNLIFRYDNTPHFPEVKSFPHHKHLQESVVATKEPSILQVIEEARLLIPGSS